MKGNRKRRPCSHDRLFLNSGNFKTGLVGGRLKGKRGKEIQVPQDASARCTDVVMAVSFYLSRKKDYDSLFRLPVEEKAIMGTWPALAIPCSPCLARKRR